jgi:hypothetical protein
MNPPSDLATSARRHAGPPLGLVAVIFTVLFNIGLYFVVSFGAGKPHFPGPWESADAIVAFYRNYPASIARCAFFQFGSSITLGIFTATVVSRLRFLGVRAAGAFIALFGGFAASVNIAASTFLLWATAFPGVAQDSGATRALYYLQFAFGGVGFSVPMGLLIAGICIPAAFLKLLPKWMVIFGLVLAVCGELSSLDLLFPQALFLIPLTRFPGFVWLIVAGFKLPNSTTRNSPETLGHAPAFA